MRGPLAADDIEDLYGRARSVADHRAAVAQLDTWVDQPHPDDEVSPASLLVSAGEHLTRAGDHDEAVSYFRRACQAGQHVAPDVRCYLHGALLETGDVERAWELADELRRERPTDPDVYTFVGENYEGADDLGEAHRWLTIGAQRCVHRVEEGDDTAASDAVPLLMARLRVRRALELPMDDLDALVVPALLAESEHPD